MELTWVEISREALTSNIKTFRRLVGSAVKLGVAVKANAYGHGLTLSSRIFLKAGADYLCVNAIYEAETLRKAGVKAPLLIIGYTPLSDLPKVVQLKCELVVYNVETIRALGKLSKPVKVHLKIETGNHRQGVRLSQIPAVLTEFKKYKNLQMGGISTHFANIEDRVHHHYALHQLKEFKKAIRILEEAGHAPHYRHCANSAAAIVLPEAHFNFVRVGIGAYGLWPSEKTLKAAQHAGINIKLKPALTWKTIVAQIKEVDKGALVGYGCTYQMPHTGRIAVLPVGYYDGYVRLLSNKGHVLIHGKKAPVIGRVCMNMIMVDVSRIPEAQLEDEVILIGKQGKEEVTAEEMAELSQTINYEVTTRINERIPRIFIS
ncbi:alanine racemase [Candidatus Peregrinibacteria bacterium]|nr:alanine racemase [Candidatus Peregrinibacteria bacterium]